MNLLGILSRIHVITSYSIHYTKLYDAKAEIAAAALACGVVPSHNVTTELKDLDYIRNDALRARREFGYLRMWSIHPNQIVPIVEAMRPDFSEVEAAGEILIAAQDKA